MKFTPLGLSVPELTDPPAGPAQIGGLAEEVDPLLQAGGVGKHLYVSGEVTRASTAYGSFSTPIRVTIPRVLPSQIIEILAIGYGKVSVLSNKTVGGAWGVSIGGSVVQEERFAPGLVETAANTVRQFATTPLGIFLNTPPNSGSPTPAAPHDVVALGGHEGGQEPTTSPFKAPGWMLWTPSAEKTNLAIEVVGKSSSGTITAIDWLLLARVSG